MMSTFFYMNNGGENEKFANPHIVEIWKTNGRSALSRSAYRHERCTTGSESASSEKAHQLVTGEPR